MICAADELGIGDDHSGILVLPTGTAQPGDDALELLGLNDTVIEVAPTPDRGYAFSVRGLAREIACALEVPFGDPGAVEVPEPEGEAWPVHIEDRTGCSRFVARRVSGVDPTAPTPWWMRRRLMLAGIRSISLPVDVTNYVMLELGQPLHSFDASALQGGMVVRRALPGEKLTTLDDAVRALDPDDIVIADDSGVDLAGRCHGRRVDRGPRQLHGHPARGRELGPGVHRPHGPPPQAARPRPRSGSSAPSTPHWRRSRWSGPRSCSTTTPSGSIKPGRTDVGPPTLPEPVSMPIDLPDRIAGVRYARGVTARRLGQIGCQVAVDHVRRRPDDRHGRAADAGAPTSCSPPTWWRRCCGWRATTRSPPCCRPRPPAAA